MIGLANNKKAAVREYYAPLGYKPCWSCGRVLLVGEFGKCKTSPDGLQVRCRECASSSVRESYVRHRSKRLEESSRRQKDNPEQARARKRRWKSRHRDETRAKGIKYYEENREAVLARNREWREACPEKQLAKNMVYRAIVRGDLCRPSACSNPDCCGESETIDAHHDDYSKPLDVRFLCRICHKRLHAELDVPE